MIDLQLWLVITRNTEVERAPLRAAHREYMAELVAQGAIFASGPIAPGTDRESHGGATALLVTDGAEARRIMDNEPFVRGGARTYELVAWHLRHGNFASH